MKHAFNRGVTFVELLLVVSIVAIVSASTTPFITRFLQQNNTEVTVDTVRGYLRKAQELSMDGKSDAIWGVCTSGSTLRLYTGTCDSPTQSNDYTIPSNISINGLTDVSFSKRRGEPSTPQSITITSEIDTTTITVNAAGGLDIN